MSQSLRLLLVEDSEDDALLLLRELSKNGFVVDHTRVDTPAGLRHALDARYWDIVVTDHDMPGFNSKRRLPSFARLTQTCR